MCVICVDTAHTLIKNVFMLLQRIIAYLSHLGYLFLVFSQQLEKLWEMEEESRALISLHLLFSCCLVSLTSFCLDFYLPLHLLTLRLYEFVS